MGSYLRFYVLLFCFSFSFLHPASCFSWNIWDLLQLNVDPPAPSDSPPKVSHERISHQAASDPHQDVLVNDQPWFDSNNTPLFYGAWRAKSGNISPDPVARSIVSKHKARVACWPSSGGIWIKQADLVDLDFLRLSRFFDTPRQFNQAEEDRFCSRLQMVGAEWWKLPAPFEKRAHLGKEQFACDTIEDCFEPDIKNRFLVAWPRIDRACYINISRANEGTKARWMMYHNSITMQERCDSILALGGHWCRCKHECPDFDIWEHRNPEFCVDSF